MSNNKEKFKKIIDENIPKISYGDETEKDEDPKESLMKQELRDFILEPPKTVKEAYEALGLKSEVYQFGGIQKIYWGPGVKTGTGLVKKYKIPTLDYVTRSVELGRNKLRLEDLGINKLF